MSNYITIKKLDCSNGEGIGVSIFFAGCDAIPKCKGCFNSSSWSFDAGELFTNETILELLDLLDNPRINHLSILGGEPLAVANIETVIELCKRIKNKYPTKKIWLWTHKEWKYLILSDRVKELLPYIDILVDGRFIEEQKDLTLKWRGSANQRVIDVKKSLKQKCVILYTQ